MSDIFSVSCSPDDTDATQPIASEANAEELELYDRIIARICSVYDPEIPVNIFDLGLIYKIALNKSGEHPLDRYNVCIDMTLTSIGCPMADIMPQMVKDALLDIKDLNLIHVRLVWDPPWDPSRMSEAALFQLDMM